MAQNTNNLDVPIMIGTGVICLIAIGICYWKQPEVIRPAPPAEPITTPLNAAAAPPAMMDTSGTGKAGEVNAAPSPAGGGGGAGSPAAVGGAPTSGKWANRSR